MVVVNDSNAVVISSNRLQEGSVPALEQGMVVGQLALADSLIIGNCNNQVGRLLLLHSAASAPASPSLVGWTRLGSWRSTPSSGFSFSNTDLRSVLVLESGMGGWMGGRMVGG